jgi:hypothetical protein
MNRILTTAFLFLLSSVATAQPDYTNELFTYIDSSGEKFVVETHTTDGIITADPTRLKITNQSGEVVHIGDWTTTIISVQDSENKHTVFEYSDGIPVPEKTVIFENGRFYEGEASLVSYVKSVAIYAFELLALATILALLFLLSRRSIIAHIVVFSLTALFILISLNVFLFPLSVLVMYLLMKVVYRKLVDRIVG